MRVVLVAATSTILFALSPAVLAQQSTNTQQERMKSCNAQAGAKNLSSDARKTFMSTCLSGKQTSGSGSSTSAQDRQTSGSGSSTSPQDRMKSCNSQASTQGLKGNDRTSFMSTCLKGS